MHGCTHCLLTRFCARIQSCTNSQNKGDYQRPQPHHAHHRTVPETPQTVTHVFGVISFANPPMRRISLLDVQTRSQMKLGSVPPSILHHVRRMMRYETSNIYVSLLNIPIVISIQAVASSSCPSSRGCCLQRCDSSKSWNNTPNIWTHHLFLSL